MADQSLRQLAYSAIMQRFIETGFAPHYTELAGLLEVTPEEARAAQRQAVEMTPFCWFIPDTDYIHSFAPFSNTPTQYRISVDGVFNGFALCGLAVFGLRWVFPGKEITVDMNCIDCGELMHVAIRDDEILKQEPESMIGQINTPMNDMVAGKVSWAYG